MGVKNFPPLSESKRVPVPVRVRQNDNLISVCPTDETEYAVTVTIETC